MSSRGPLPHEAEWIRLDLTTRNEQVRRVEDALHHQAQFTIALIAGTAALISSSVAPMVGPWRLPTCLSLALIYAALGLRSVWLSQYMLTAHMYIRGCILPRLRELYDSDPEDLYGWERHIAGEFSAWIIPAGAIAEILLYAVPFLALLVYGLCGLKLAISASPVLSIALVAVTCAVGGYGVGGIIVYAHRALKARDLDHIELPSRSRVATGGDWSPNDPPEPSDDSAQYGG